MPLAELRESGEGVAVTGRRGRSRHDGGVGQDSARTHVHALGEVVTGLPQGTHDTERSPTPDTVHA